MLSRYDYMRESKVVDIDGEKFPDPLTIDYTGPTKNLSRLPGVITLDTQNIKKLWLAFYKATEELAGDDILYSVNGIEHIGLLEPEDTIRLYDTSLVSQFTFKDLTD